MADGATDRYEVVDHRLQEAVDKPLAEWLRAKREAKASWQTISFQLWQHTHVQVNPETLRRWYTRQQTQAGEGSDAPVGQ